MSYYHGHDFRYSLENIFRLQIFFKNLIRDILAIVINHV